MEFDINGAEYRAKKMTVFEQLKVCRKLLPVLSSIVPDLAALRETAGAVSGDDAVAGKIINTLLPKMADVLAEMSEESVEAILHPCLSVVSRRTVSGGWAPVFRDGELMFDDIDPCSELPVGWWPTIWEIFCQSPLRTRQRPRRIPHAECVT